MEIGISTWIYHLQPIDVAIHTIHEYASAIHHVELWGNTPAHLNPLTCSPLHIETLRQLLYTNDLIPHSCHAPFANLNLSDPTRLEHAIHAILKTITLCQELDCPALTLHISASPGVQTQAELQQAKECAIEALNMIVDYAQTHRVEILLENLVPRSQHLRLGADVEDLIDIINVLDSHSVGICIDTGHSILNKQDPSNDIRKAGHWLKSLHINDNNGIKDLHAAPGSGIIQWDQVYQALQDIGYKGIFMLEVEGQNPIEQTIQTAIEYSSTLFQ
jgi:sugar phosphate isomerase/epimerase